jgi:hypothetical protein
VTVAAIIMIGIDVTGLIVWFLGAIVGVTWLACTAMDALDRRRRKPPVATVVNWTELRRRMEGRK